MHNEEGIRSTFNDRHICRAGENNLVIHREDGEKTKADT